MKYPYMSNTGNLKRYLSTISERRVPDIVDEKYLQQLGFTSKNDRPILKVLQFIGFLDDKLKPTENYSNFRTATLQHNIIDQCIKDAYDELYGLYADAHLQSRDRLSYFFKVNTNLGDSSIKYVVNTFLTLCEFGFDIPTSSVVSISKDSHQRKERPYKEPSRFTPTYATRMGTSDDSNRSTLKLKIEIDSDITPDALRSLLIAIKKELLDGNEPTEELDDKGSENQ